MVKLLKKSKKTKKYFNTTKIKYKNLEQNSLLLKK